jgi:uncharacterized membrane protein YjgN (DUF898 family)/Tfp pilus assembly protein PilF
MAKGNCQFSGTGGQYFVTVIIHLLLLGTLTLGIYTPWAWVRLLKLKASHTTMNGKPVQFIGSGGELLILWLIQGLLTMVTFGFYFPWAICVYFRWRARNTLVDETPCQFTGTGGSLFFFYLIHLMILPIITMGIYSIYGLFRFYAWKEEHTRYGGKRTSFGASFWGFVKITVISYILTLITLYLFTPWAMCMLFKWQIEGLAVGDEKEVKHFPPVKTNWIVVAIFILIGLLPFIAIGVAIMSQYKDAKRMQAQMAGIEKKKALKKKAVKKPVLKEAPAKTPDAYTAAHIVVGKGILKKPIEDKSLDITSEIEKMDKVIEKDPKNADALYNRAWLNAYQGNREKAREDYNRVLEIKPDHENAVFNHGLIMVEMKKYDLALQDFSEVIKQNAKAADAYCNRGNVYYQMGKLDLAIKDFNAALDIDPKDGDLFYNRAVIYLAKGEKEEAKKDFKKAANLGSFEAKRHLNLPTSTPDLSKETRTKPEKASATGLKMIEIPEKSASGKIRGEDFTVENAKIENGILTLRQGEDFFPDLAVTIFLFLEKGEKLGGKAYHIDKDDGMGVPHIHMKWRKEGEDLPKTKIFMESYVMRLEFGRKKNGTLPGKIYLSLPDEGESHVSGTFEAELK